MSNDDLLKMFGLDNQPTNQPAKKERLNTAKATPTKAAEDVQVSDTALVLDSWDYARGRDIIKEHHRRDGLDESALADFHAGAFQREPELTPACSDQDRHDFIRALMGSPDYETLHNMSKGNTVIAQMTAMTFAKDFLKFKEEKDKGKPKKNPAKEEERKELACLGNAHQAVQNALEEADEFYAVARGCGLEPGSDTNQGDLNKIAECFNTVRDSNFLRKVFNSAGRFRCYAQSAQRQKINHGKDDVVGVELSNDIGRLVPMELAMLADEDFEDDALRRLIEGQSMSYKHQGLENVGKGPIVVCLDESGSMGAGDRIIHGKAFALTMAWVAKHQKRFCILAGFSSGPVGNYLILKPGKWDQQALLAWLAHFYQGGTTLDVPLATVPQKWAEWQVPKGKTDLIIISDGIVGCHPQMEQDFLAWKKAEKVRCISMILESSPGPMERLSEECHLIRGIDLNEAGIQHSLSI
jgi:uncharacterized protein with von Willebrand factor type A (vWA) domain